MMVSSRTAISSFQSFEVQGRLDAGYSLLPGSSSESKSEFDSDSEMTASSRQREKAKMVSLAFVVPDGDQQHTVSSLV